jgi:PKD repeat protein
LPQLSYFWNFGNGQTDTSANPSVTFSNPSTNDTSFTVSLTVTNAFGCTDSSSQTITVHPNAKAQLNVLSSVECAPFTIDTSKVKPLLFPNANTSYLWKIIKNNSVIASFSGPDSLNYTIANDGDSVIVRLIALSPYNCKADSTEQLLYTFTNPKVGFLASATSGCHPMAVNLVDTSDQNLALEWYINGTLISTAKNLSIVLSNTSLNADSIFEIKLIGSHPGTGCKDSSIQQIIVYPLPNPDFNYQNVCLGEQIAFTDLSTPADSIVSWKWNFGNGDTSTSKNPTYQYPAPGIYIVSLEVTDSRGCKNSVQKPVTVRPLPVPDFSVVTGCGSDTVCVGQPVQITDLSTSDSLSGNIVQWHWDIFNNGSIDYSTKNIVHTFQTTGLIPVKLKVVTDQGCSDSIVKFVSVIQKPAPYFKLSADSICGPASVSITDSSQGIINYYYWEFWALDSAMQKVVFYTDSGAQVANTPVLMPSYKEDTTYYVTLRVGNCCGYNEMTDSVVIKTLPVGNFLALPDSGCSPLQVTFQLDGLVDGSPDSVVIDFGFNNQKVTVFPVFVNTGTGLVKIWGQQVQTFTYSGTSLDTTYFVTLTAYNDCGDSSKTIPIKVAPNTVQAFFQNTPSIGCAPLTVQFQNFSFGASYIGWCFDFNPITKQCMGTTSILSNPSYTYSTPGIYTAALFASNNCGFDTITTQIVVLSSPIADFVANTQICEGDTVFFQNTSQADSGLIVQNIWHFGTGDSSLLSHPWYVYQTPGTYQACLKVITNYGCPDSICYPITVYPKPTVQFYAQDVCFSKQPVHFYDSSTVSLGSLVSTIWKFGDGNTSVTQNPQHTYSQPGQYTVTLIKQSNLGCIDSVKKIVNVYPDPDIDFSMMLIAGDSCSVPQTYQFNNLSTNAFGFVWDFDYMQNPGVNTSTLNNPSFTFTSPGIYHVALIGGNQFGCWDTVVRTILVGDGVVSNFTPDSAEGCVPLTIQFNDASLYTQGVDSIVNWIWDFGDGTTVSGIPNPIHTYFNAGSYTVKLTAETALGCLDTVTKSGFVKAYYRPKVNFDFEKENIRRVRFINQTDEGGIFTIYRWNTGDGNTADSTDLTYTYERRYLGNDSVEVCLYAQNVLGCDSMMCKRIWLWRYNLIVPNAFAPDLTDVGEGNVFLPKGHSLKKYELKIYDTWGNLVFRSEKLDENGSPSEPWDGRHLGTGKVLPMGAYVWTIIAVFDDGTIWPGQIQSNGELLNFGTVTLIR